MYNKIMKKISVLILLALLISINSPLQSQAGIFNTYKLKAEQNREYKSNYEAVKKVIDSQTVYTNKYDLKGLATLYSDNFVNSDGFNKDIYFKLIDETWKTYPDITYTTEIKNIDFNENYATVFVHETAVATATDTVGEVQVIGELYSTAKCVYFLEKTGSKWVISSEKIVEETSSLRYGDARYIKMELNSPKQIGPNKYYTTTLKVDAPSDSVVIASISKENIVYPQTKADDAFRKLPDDNILERVFLSNKNNVNEYTVASVGITKAEPYNENEVKVYMGGLAFIMTRVNVIPENKYIKIEPENTDEVKDSGKGK
ncbi:putative uncharacterized protein [Clostridium sp. CAG:967]|nr:putative uncharacterized protein [Clostridium sp. CAG:967]